jgi:hypothetical protein
VKRGGTKELTWRLISRICRYDDSEKDTQPDQGCVGSKH